MAIGLKSYKKNQKKKKKLRDMLPHFIYLRGIHVDSRCIYLHLYIIITLSLFSLLFCCTFSSVLLMDSWKHLSDGRGVWLSEESGFPVDVHGRFNNKEIEHEIKPFSNVEGCPLVSNPQALERLDFMDLGFCDDIRNSFSLSREPSAECFSGEIAADSYGNVISTFRGKTEFDSRISTDFMQSEIHDCSLIDLKLGRLADGGGSMASVTEPSDMSCFMGKRTRSTALYPRSSCCQVLGCNKDLSSFRSYYKRHKVCDMHTKTAKVIVDGIEQRFCQQCSRFHVLAEFDDGKRSCRRRLAAHNKRRRKAQLISEPGMVGLNSSFSFQDVLPSVVESDIVGEQMDNFRVGNRNVEILSDTQQNGRALSLLSAASHNFPLGAESRHAESSPGHAAGHSAELFRHDTQSGVHAPGIYSMEGRGVILDLRQLSSNLQRIEQQRHSTESEGG